MACRYQRQASRASQATACLAGAVGLASRLPDRRGQASGTACCGRKKTKELEPFAFEAEESDHCETPTMAYLHVARLLEEIAQAKFPDERRKSARGKLRIYDPYYCQGGAKKKLTKLGFENVHNENEDFYKVCNTPAAPAFDVLVTNPPFSSRSHLAFLLDFVVASSKPWLAVVPVHGILQDEYLEAVERIDPELKPFYMVPPKKYNFKTPAPLPKPPTENRSQARSRSRHAYTLWVVQGGPDIAMRKRLLEAAVQGECRVAETVAGLPSDCLPFRMTVEMRENAKRQGITLPD
eukprot:TRINITY_DN47183_c0_g1_i1.p1 TRINITY_DN47183_c0_g1~~TRINITY_DN47183_c0_g1_i1.p1  ORF type:complete len:345 (-),score=77.74 TRINITY_DN47183_c0_g1_i1:10-891(-)